MNIAFTSYLNPLYPLLIWRSASRLFFYYKCKNIQTACIVNMSEKLKRWFISFLVPHAKAIFQF